MYICKIEHPKVKAKKHGLCDRKDKRTNWTHAWQEMLHLMVIIVRLLVGECFGDECHLPIYPFFIFWYSRVVKITKKIISQINVREKSGEQNKQLIQQSWYSETMLNRNLKDGYINVD